MSPNETRMLTDFLGQLRAVAGAPRDPQAATLIADAVAAQPDAPYFLVQRALLQDQALVAANERIASLEAELRTLVVPVAPAAAASSFLDGGSNAWGRSVTASTQVQATSVDSRPAFSAPAQAMPIPVQATAQAPAAAGFFGGGGGNFLGTMAATAAGVAGGAFLFQGIGNLMGHHGDAAHAGAPAAGQANPFSSMADSVGSTPSATSTPAATPLADSDVTDIADTSVASDDSMFDGDDSFA
ncbi:DUF2076 domain-containing protein [Actimicrobium antarcticum]|uniref:DUF2076 domain-containing protein n=1 Tax=Actimicrobium antarcticum TaxID=1051899 RepID=A0ABP7TEQ8_9BURK